MRTSSFSTNTCASHKSSPAAFPSDPRLVTLRSRAPTHRAPVNRFCHSLERSQPLLAPCDATVRIRDFERGRIFRARGGIPRKLALSHFDETALSVQGNVQLVRQLSRAKRTAGKIAARDMQCGNSSLAVIRAQHNLLRFMVLLDVDFPELHSALFQKHFHAPAVRAPSCTVDRDRLHPLFCCHPLYGSGLRKTACRHSSYRISTEAPRYFFAIWIRIRARCSATVARSQSKSLSNDASRFSARAKAASARARSISAARSAVSASTVTRSGSTSANPRTTESAVGWLVVAVR